MLYLKNSRVYDLCHLSGIKSLRQQCHEKHQFSGLNELLLVKCAVLSLGNTMRFYVLRDCIQRQILSSSLCLCIVF